MNLDLKKAVNWAVDRGLQLGEPFCKHEFFDGPNRDRCAVVNNERTHKAGLIYYESSTEEVKFYMLCFKKLDWLETEGWSLTEIMSKLPEQVLSEVTKRAFPYELSIEAD
jgi:hypothetical protein